MYFLRSIGRSQLPTRHSRVVRACSVSRIYRNRRQLSSSYFASVNTDVLLFAPPSVDIVDNILATSAMGSSVGPAMTGVLSVLPTVFCTSLVMSPLLTCRDIRKNESIGQLSPMPVVACANTCVVFTIFGSLLNEGQGDWVVMTPNIIGATLSVYYIWTFHTYSPPGTMTKWYAGSLGVMTTAISAGLGLLPVSSEVALSGLGYAASSLALWLALSPLSGLGHVFREKSTAGMVRFRTYCVELPFSLVRFVEVRRSVLTHPPTRALRSFALSALSDLRGVDFECGKLGRLRLSCGPQPVSLLPQYDRVLGWTAPAILLRFLRLSSKGKGPRRVARPQKRRIENGKYQHEQKCPFPLSLLSEWRGWGGFVL